jgi:hypothetical protein
MKRYTQQQVKGVTVTQRLYSDESGHLQVRARSQRQADKLAARLDWFSYSGGTGRPFANVSFSCGYLVMQYGWDN